MSYITACPLDCYDACSVVFDEGRLKGLRDGFTQGFLCPNLNHYFDYDVIKQPSYNGEVITMDEALDKLKEILKSTKKEKILHYRGSGNFALMQGVTDHFFASYGATLSDGSLCDGAGEAGIIEGRGSNKNMPVDEIAKSDVVIFWGRDPHTTSSHLLPLIKDKKIIVIDPVKTKIAKEADLYMQIKPRGDMLLAMLLCRFAYISDVHDEEYLENYASEYMDFYELTQTIRIKQVLESIDVSLGDIGKILDMVHGKRLAIVCGVGIQKYRDGASTMRAIDAFATYLGLFGKEGCGVAYLGESKQNITNPFNSKAKKVSKVDTKFDDFDTVFIQGANPLSQMPDSTRVFDSIKNVKNVVYFGLYENETSSVANLIIPAKPFLYKDDIRTSYSHNALVEMPKTTECDFGISEYDLSAYLCNEFGIEIKSQDDYIEHFKSFGEVDNNGDICVKGREDIPYQRGFDTDDGEFLFLDECEPKIPKDDDKLNLITPKATHSLNSQFRRSEYVYLNPKLGYFDNEEVKISSDNGSVILKVKNSDDVRDDCVLIYSGTKGVNNLTTSKYSYEGKCAIFQENRVVLNRL